MYKPYCGLIMTCARLRARVPERAICQTAQTILWFAENTYTNHIMVWSREGNSSQLGAGNTPVGSDSALGGRKWAKRALLGGFWPSRTVRACFGGEDARMTPKCGTSMDRAHRDLSAPVQLEYRLGIIFDSPPFVNPAAPAPPSRPSCPPFHPPSQPSARPPSPEALASFPESVGVTARRQRPPTSRAPATTGTCPPIRPPGARRLCAGKGKGKRARAGPDLGPGPSSSRAPSSSPARPPARTNARACAHTPIRVALNGAIAHVMNGRKSESRIERSSASESDCRDPPIAALANPALIPRGRSLSDPKRCRSLGCVAAGPPAGAEAIMQTLCSATFDCFAAVYPSCRIVHDQGNVRPRFMKTTSSSS